MIKILFFFISLLLTAIFLNMKFSQSVRILAYGEVEPKKEAIISFVLMIVIVVFWTIFYSIV